MAAAILKGLFGGAKPSASPIPAGDSGAQYVADPPNHTFLTVL